MLDSCQWFHHSRARASELFNLEVSVHAFFQASFLHSAVLLDLGKALFASDELLSPQYLIPRGSTLLPLRALSPSTTATTQEREFAY
ncbi:hypothetical protein B0H19DRAFT_1137090 [Mycena capillaripes]|nr:hypothetical protein B0H19DRAFT_1137090 [Mycena capillaripes]